MIWGLCFSGGGFFSGTVQSQPAAASFIEYLEFREVDIKDVLRQLARQYNLNIVFSESVSGLITVQLHGVTVEEALDSIITINGFVYTRKGEVYKVTTPEESEREGKQTKVFTLSNADAAKLKTSLEKMLSSDGTIEADDRSNSLIITDTPGVINKVQNMVPSLDGLTPQVLIEAKFIETSLGTTEQLGIDWTSTVTAQGASRPTTFPFNNWGSDQTYYTSPSYTVTDDGGTVTVESDYELRNDFTGWPTTPIDFASFPAAAASEFSFGTLDFTDFQAVLQMLRTKTESKLISSPRVVTTNNKQAEMYVGKARPIPQFEFNSDTGEYQINGFNEKIEGVILTVTPQISYANDNDVFIKLKLKPKVTNFTGEVVSFSGLNFDYPVLSERYADTEVIIKNGQTIVIGGLIESKKTEIVRKVPILGDIPLLGLLFTHRNTNPDSKSELLIFVTARTVIADESEVLALESSLRTSPSRPLKQELRKVELE